MSFLIDHMLHEQMRYISPAFPITYFHDELIELPNREGPVHWHPEFEIVTAKVGVLDYQAGKEHIFLNEGDSIFVNSDILHGIRQISGEIPDPMPGIVFLGTMIAPQDSPVYQKYVLRILSCDALPYVVFRKGECETFHQTVQRIYQLMEERSSLYELKVMAALTTLFIFLNEHFDEFPRVHVSRVQVSTRVRAQQMLNFIYRHYDQNITLADISSAASISRSEAGRCFLTYLGYTPIDYLIRFRLQKAYSCLCESSRTIAEISRICGFSSVSYFSRQFKNYYGCSPGAVRDPGK